MNELFLIALPLLTVFIHGDDRAPAITYCLAAHLINVVAMTAGDTQSEFLINIVIDVVLVGLLVCLAGCLRSRITSFLIPLSILSVIMNFCAWNLDMVKADFSVFNSIVILYMCVILALFVSRAIGYGDSNRNNRFLRRDDNHGKNMGMVSK